MKKTLIALVLGALIAPIAFAGPYGGRGPNLDRMAEQLDLSAEQKARIEQIVTENRAQRQQMREQHREQIRAVLNDEQKARFDELRANRPYREDCPRAGGQGMGPRHGG